MAKPTVKELVLKVLGTQCVTMGQLIAQFRIEWTHRYGIEPRNSMVHSSVRQLERAGVIVSEADDIDGTVRFSIPEPQYHTDSVLDNWLVLRKHPDVPDHEIQIGFNMSEAEARICVAALNDMNRKVRSIKRK